LFLSAAPANDDSQQALFLLCCSPSLNHLVAGDIENKVRFLPGPDTVFKSTAAKTSYKATLALPQFFPIVQWLALSRLLLIRFYRSLHNKMQLSRGLL
jgi:hypothetical protein